MTGRERLDLLDPFEVAQLGGIELVARGVVEGFLAGLHQSPFHGFSVEFAEHRAYQEGDDLRYVDWKMLARSDRLFVKQFEEETNLRSMLLLDVSRSMAWSGAPDSRLSKRAYAERLVAALSLILLRQRDATGLVAFDDEIRGMVPARARTGQWQQLLVSLMGVTGGGATVAEEALRRVTDLLARRGMVVFLSDLLFDRELALLALKFLRHRGHQVLVFHIMDPAEVTLEGPAEARFKDLESDVVVVARPRQLARVYRDTVQREIRAWRTACRRHGIGYQQVLTDMPFGNVLRRAVAKRTHLG